MGSLDEKYAKLQDYFKEKGSAAVAFSGGVDSTLLLKVAHDVLGDKAIAMTAVSTSFPEWERSDAAQFCRDEGIQHILFESKEMEMEGFRFNPPNRCYLCKTATFSGMIKLAKEHHLAVVVEGSNTDDDGDYRPGRKATKELGVESPLYLAGMDKADIRELSQQLKLPTWKKPSFACLTSRFAYGEEISDERLAMVEKAEKYMMSLGFFQQRVRIHGTIARIEVTQDQFDLLFEKRDEIAKTLKEIGFSYVTADLMGYRTGSMNEVLKDRQA